MKIKSISFENYKAFSEKQTIQLKPITVLIGKNSSGKSSIAKLFTLLENSLSGEINEPLLVKNNSVELGAEFRDLVFGRGSTPISFEILFQGKNTLKCSVLQDTLKYDLNIIKWSYNSFEISYSPEQGFIDSEGTQYDCEFKGFIPSKLTSYDGIDKLKEFDLGLKFEIDYIGPFRLLPERQFYLTGQINYKITGIKGENAYSMLGVSQKMKSDLHEKVGDWYSKHFGGWRLIVADRSPYYEIKLVKNDTEVNIVDVGQGMNQALPLVVRANTGKKNSVIVIEQPELHLHPAAHGELAELFAKSAKENDQVFIIETHSENILLRLRKLIVENDFGFIKDDLVIYWIDEGEYEGQTLREITVDEDGVLSDWPEGVFNENLKEIMEIQNALTSKGKS